MAEIIDSGTVGDCSWTYYDNRSLIIDGQGTAEFLEGVNPWASYRITSVTIASGVQAFDCFKAFDGQDDLYAVNLSEGLMRIGAYAFANCGQYNANYNRIVIPDSVTEMGQAAFSNCYFQYMTVGAGVREIPGNCFYNNIYCRSMTIRGDVEKIGAQAFYNLGATYHSASSRPYTEFSCNFNYVREIEASAFQGAIIGNWYESTMTYRGFVLHSLPRAETIGIHAFDGCTLYGDLYLSPTTTSLGEYAFQNTKLLAVYYKADVRGIPAYCFARNFDLQYVEIANGTMGIGRYAFELCGRDSGSTTYMVPYSVNSIHTQAFQNAKSLIVVDNFPGSLGFNDPHWGLNGDVIYLRRKTDADACQFYKKTASGVMKMIFYKKTATGVEKMFFYKGR